MAEKLAFEITTSMLNDEIGTVLENHHFFHDGEISRITVDREKQKIEMFITLPGHINESVRCYRIEFEDFFNYQLYEISSPLGEGIQNLDTYRYGSYLLTNINPIQFGSISVIMCKKIVVYELTGLSDVQPNAVV